MRAAGSWSYNERLSDLQFRQEVSMDAAGQTGARPRVLIVDDDVDTVQSTALLFDLQGFDADMAFGGLHALDRAREAFPDLVLLDLAMPEMDGFEVARALREMRPDPSPYLVAVTGFAYPADRKRCAEAGFDLHLPKPVDFGLLEQLAATVKTSRERIATARELGKLQLQATGKFMLVQLDMAHTLLDVAQTTRNTQTRDRCITKARRAHLELTQRLVDFPYPLADLDAGIAALARRFEELVRTL